MKRLMVFLFAMAVVLAMTTSSFAWQAGTEAGQEQGQKREAKKETEEGKEGRPEGEEGKEETREKGIGTHAVIGGSGDHPDTGVSHFGLAPSPGS